ncbi:MAG: DUF512 domain-containing protein [Ruminococcaceae bacterium]|nr:DUF512 domain-containing protein [Oscillospiraceae bacterium]
MSVVIGEVIKGSPACRAGIKAGDTLISLNGEEIVDVLDYRFYQNDSKVKIEFLNAKGRLKAKTVKKNAEDELGLCFETYLMDSQRSCKNKCVFCFIDQLPKGMRQSLYFKDDDSRLSFLFGNYITLTNLTEHEISRIIKMHISPVNISVHTTNPELRVQMMKNKHAGEVLSIIDRLNEAGIRMNCQLVLCPDYNDGEELKKTLADLTAKENIGCIAAVPVGLTKHREGLPELKPFDKERALKTVEILEHFGAETKKATGQRKVFASDEFYILAEKPIPEADFYEDFLQLENGVGLWALLKSEANSAIEDAEGLENARTVSIATGVSAYPLIVEIVDKIKEKCHNLTVNVYPIKNEFFGEQITVSGLITGGDILNQLEGKTLGDELLIPSSMLRHENDLFLDDMHIDTLSVKLGVKVTAVNNDGYELTYKILGKVQ